MIKKIKNASLSVIQNLSAPIADIAVKLQVLNPEWAIAVGMGAGLLAVYRELAENRGVELLGFIEEHKDQFLEEIIKTPNFKATFVNVWEMHIRENSEAKRKRLRNFLLNFGKGKKIDPDLHTKIYSVIEQMTDLEAEIFGILYRGSNKEQFKNMNLNSDAITGLKAYQEPDIRDVCNSLHSYRLITIGSEPAIGASVTIRQITGFGELFYKFVCNEDEE